MNRLKKLLYDAVLYEKIFLNDKRYGDEIRNRHTYTESVLMTIITNAGCKLDFEKYVRGVSDEKI